MVSRKDPDARARTDEMPTKIIFAAQWLAGIGGSCAQTALASAADEDRKRRMYSSSTAKPWITLAVAWVRI